MSAFDRFEFGFPVPGGISYTPNDGEFSFIKGKPSPVGPWIPLGPTVQEVYETQVQRGMFHRAGNGTYGPTWLAVLTVRPDKLKDCTNLN